MHLQPHLDALAADLLQSARVGGDDMHAAAERLVAALEPATRLMVLDVLSQACAEITAELDSGSVDVRLDGREPRIAVTPGLPRAAGAPAPGTDDAHPQAARSSAGGAEAPDAPDASDDAEDADDQSLARVTVRVPAALKAAAESRAADAGQSLNTWIVAAMRRATRPATPFPPFPTDPWGRGPAPRSGRVLRGWAD